MPRRATQVCTIGLWHLGVVTSACLAKLGYRVIGVDADRERIERLMRGEPPLFEPGLAELIQQHLADGRLTFTSNLEEAVRRAETVIIAFDTPVDANDEIDVSPVRETIRAIAPWLQPRAMVLMESQMPVGTCQRLSHILQQAQPTQPPRLAYVPENLRLGNALARFLNPTMLIIGAQDESAQEAVDAFFSDVPSPRIFMDLATAEMTKHALNAFFATCVSFANELGQLCDAVGADGLKVADALRADERIGRHALVVPGAPFGGGTLARDLRVLQHVGRAHESATPLLDAIFEVNERQKRLVLTRLTHRFGTLSGLKVGLLGLTYKAGTSTLRRSPALELIGHLVAAGAQVSAYDPKADMSELRSAMTFRLCHSAYEAAEGMDALVISTEWPEFRELDFRALRNTLRTPLILDTKNFLDPAMVMKAGCQYIGIGRGTVPRPAAGPKGPALRAALPSAAAAGRGTGAEEQRS